MNETTVNSPGGVAIAGKRVLVTGANRGLGKAFVQELLDGGAARVYAAAQNPDAVDFDDARVVPVSLDITKSDDIRDAASGCSDVTVLINNAGAMLRSPLLASPDLSAARSEMETNYFGTLAMCRAFAPVLARQGGGALVNVLSIASWFASPFNGSYGASKSAEWALTNAIRVELRAQGTLVVGVHAGWIDTDMADTVAAAKLSPGDVASQTLAAIQHGDEEVLTDDGTRRVKASLPHDLTALYPDVQKRWDAGDLPW
ncbi:KR domain-containing protein [Mycobacterium ahvazicum]|uniref:KR domain-containing protein n=1 Tax=Mycobacterium ahvazicum TaxID=1964395 RepID=A0A2K4YDH6_9MYCO|nr:SDR family oxidoreductase [Mycobacterium ahvazicum]SOX54831.1 KR domain-containing protein [Mycobacterium ahvazicum]